MPIGIPVPSSALVHPTGVGVGQLDLCYSQYGPGTSTLGNTWELVRAAESQAPR